MTNDMLKKYLSSNPIGSKVTPVTSQDTTIFGDAQCYQSTNGTFVASIEGFNGTEYEDVFVVGHKNAPDCLIRFSIIDKCMIFFKRCIRDVSILSVRLQNEYGRSLDELRAIREIAAHLEEID